MMKRREFAGVIGAGLLFPQNLLKGAICEPEDTSVALELDLGAYWHHRSPKKFLIISLGNDEHPVCKEYLRVMKVYYSQKTVTNFLNGRHPVNDWLVPRTYEYVKTKHLVLGIGSKRRPVPEAEYLDFRNEVSQQLGRGKDIIVTRHAITACIMTDIACGVEGSLFPLVLHHDDSLFKEHFELRMWMNVAMTIGGGP